MCYFVVFRSVSNQTKIEFGLADFDFRLVKDEIDRANLKLELKLVKSLMKQAKKKTEVINLIDSE